MSDQKGSVTYPQERASGIPIVYGPVRNLDDAEKTARAIADLGADVVIDFQEPLGSRRSGFVVRCEDPGIPRPFAPRDDA